MIATVPGKAVGRHLRRLRDKRQMSMVDVQLQTGVAVSSLSRIETGQREPTTDTLEKLADLFGVPDGAILYIASGLMPAWLLAKMDAGRVDPTDVDRTLRRAFGKA